MKKNVGISFDLLYPSAEKRRALEERRGKLAASLPQDWYNDLEIRDTAQLVCPENPMYLIEIIKELCTDEEVINYRLDAMEDFIACPKIIPAVYKMVRTLLNDERLNGRDKSSPDSFAAFRASVRSLDVFAQAVDEMYGICGVYNGKARSAAVKGLLKYFGDIHDSDSFAEMKNIIAELGQILSSRVRSVTVAINFDEDMRPTEAGIVSISNTAASRKPTVLDRLMYPTAKRPDDYFMKNVHTKFEEGTDIPREIDRALFNDIEAATDAYLKKLDLAFDRFDRISFDNVSLLQMQLDFYSGAIRIKDAAEARGLKMCRPEILPKEERRGEIKGVFDLCFYRMAAKANPEKSGDDFIVTNDVDFGADGRFYMLTGANNGGKTTFTRGVGLCQIFAQTGIYVPAAECRLSTVDYVYTHFPKEEVVGINSSRFTTEIKELKTISDTITPYSLLLMNESIQSTTPKECVSIAKEILRIFTIIGARGIYATHLIDLASELEDINADPDNRSKLVSLIACVDESDGRRLYRIKRGNPAVTGYADTIFKQFGIDVGRVRRMASEKERI